MASENLALRFLLEIGALGGLGIWAWALASSPWRILAATIAVIVAAGLWATFAVRDDSSRSGNAPVPIPGLLRLALEWALLFGGALGYQFAGYTWSGIVLGVLVILHYLLSIERIVWLWEQ